MVKQCIQGIGQAVIKVFARRNAGQDDIQNGRFVSKWADFIKLHGLKHDTGDHRNTSLE